VAVEHTDALAVPFQGVMELLLKRDRCAAGCPLPCAQRSLCASEYLAIDNTVHRLMKVLIGLAIKLGQRSGPLVEIPTYFTQEEIAQMAAARRERISTALNSLRRQGLVQYSIRGHLALNVTALESHSG
jgi:hypothetical protein